MNTVSFGTTNRERKLIGKYQAACRADMSCRKSGQSAAKQSFGHCIDERGRVLSGPGDSPQKINVFIEARGTLGNNAPAVI
jgi:hypothetical protein